MTSIPAGTRAAVAVLALVALPAAAAALDVDVAHVRQLAVQAGLASLRTVTVPTPGNLDTFLKPGTDARRAAIQLGKALFWDTQAGSDGQACASCHFHAGADSRTKNQLSPGATGFGATAAGGGGANYQLTAQDFPFYKLEDRQDRSSTILQDSDDVVSSQGVFDTVFVGVEPGKSSERGRPVADPTFNVAGVNVRRVAGRNAPSVINAVFNVVNFWDGRAHHLFNGVSGFGPLDATATILVNERGKLVRQSIAIDHASLASQAVEPPRSDKEMIFAGRTFRDLARKLLALRPLGLQLVHPRDGVLGSVSRSKLSRGRLTGKPGLSVGYDDLIKRAFQRQYWESSKKVDGYTQMEHNFTLFFGLAVQMYESTLVSDGTRFDRFMDGDDAALTPEEQEGLLIFVNDGTQHDLAFVRLGQGACVNCHRGPEFTSITYRNLARSGDGFRLAMSCHRSPDMASTSTPVTGSEGDLELTAVMETPEDIQGVLVNGPKTAWVDNGFSNIGVRPIAEDLGRGASLLGSPLAFVRQRLGALPFAPGLPACGGTEQLPCPEDGRVAVDGAFKIPGLRNVELTGPYMHNGGQATLQQVIVFYERLGDFSDANVRQLDTRLTRIDLTEKDEQPLVQFLQSLTDECVRDEQAPFDHPQLFVPNGHPGDQTGVACTHGMQACDDLLEIPPVGADGRRNAGLAPLGTFLGLDPLQP